MKKITLLLITLLLISCSKDDAEEIENTKPKLTYQIIEVYENDNLQETFKITVTYGNNGFVSEVNDSYLEHKDIFIYNEKNQLIEIQDLTHNTTASFIYNSKGLIIEEITGDGDQVFYYTYNDKDQVITDTNKSSEGEYITNYEYNSNGNMINDGDGIYTYDNKINPVYFSATEQYSKILGNSRNNIETITRGGNTKEYIYEYNQENYPIKETHATRVTYYHYE